MEKLVSLLASPRCRCLRGILASTVLFFAAGTASATCNLTLNVPQPLTPAASIFWQGCASSGTGVQSALDAIGQNGGGNLKLSGNGSLLVGPRLYVRGNTMLHGDSARAPYGMVIVGDNTPGLGYRKVDDPIIDIRNVSGVTIWNIEFQGNSPGRPLCGQSIEIRNATSTLLTHNKISGSRQRGVTVRNSDRTTIRYLSLTMQRSTGSEPEGGAGVWFSNTSRSVLEHSTISGPTYWASGPPSSDPRAGANGTLTMDLVASYGGSANRFQHNTISQGNTAGIYLACLGNALSCAAHQRERNAVVWNNTVRNFRQHGMDIANSDRPVVVTNRISNIELAPLAMAATHDGRVQYNTLSQGGLDTGSRIIGAFYLLWGSSRNSVSNNSIFGASADYAVYLRPASQGFGDPQDNVIINNNLWRGVTSPYYVSGVIGTNTVTPNTEH